MELKRTCENHLRLDQKVNILYLCSKAAYKAPLCPQVKCAPIPR